MENRMVKHVAIIMDGNGRWAQLRNKKRTFGHKAGVEKTREIIEICAKKSIQSLTLFAFSTENWARPDDEVSYLMELFILALKREVKMLNEKNVRLTFIGDLSAFSQKLQSTILAAQNCTKDNNGLRLNIAANYGGRWDIIHAANQARQQLTGDQLITEENLNQHLSTQGLPELDLLIRTGGEKRFSNFLIWQAAYSELYFSDKLWPDFDSAELNKALDDYSERQRRYGQTSEQVSNVE